MPLRANSFEAKYESSLAKKNGAEEDRTPDPLLAKQVLSQTELQPRVSKNFFRETRGSPAFPSFFFNENAGQPLIKI